MAGRSAAPQTQARLTPEGLLVFTRGRRWARASVQSAAGLVGGDVGEAFAALPADGGASALRVALRRTWPGSLTGSHAQIWAVPLPVGTKTTPSPEGFTLHDITATSGTLGGAEQRQGHTLARVVVTGEGGLDVEEASGASALVSQLGEAFALACGEVPGALFGRTVEELLGRAAVPVGSALYVPGGDPEASGVLSSIVKIDGLLGAPSGALGLVLADFGTRDASQIEAVAQGWAQRAAAELSASAEKIREAWTKAEAAGRGLHRGAQKAAESRAARALVDAERWRGIVGDARADALRDAARDLDVAASCGDLLTALGALSRVGVATERLPEIGSAPRGGGPQATRTPAAAAPVAPAIVALPPAPAPLPTVPPPPPIPPPPAPPSPAAPAPSPVGMLALAPQPPQAPIRTGRDLIARIGQRLTQGEGVAVYFGGGDPVIMPPPLPAPPPPPPAEEIPEDLWAGLPSEEDPVLLPPAEGDDLWSFT